MLTTVTLQTVLARLARGEVDQIHQVLSLLCNEYIILPVSTKASDPTGSEKISVPTISLSGRKFVPAFTSDENFSAWSSGKFNCLSLFGADLAAAVPSGSWLIINPDSPYAVELSPEEVQRISRIALTESMTSQVSKTGDASGNYQEALDSEQEIEPLDPVIEELHSLLQKCPSVSEGYVALVENKMAELLVGVLYHRISPEERFNLLSEIAQISSRHFNSAGAIEVYDDLHLSHSSSWELFKTISPFFVRATAEENLAADRLAAQVDTIQVRPFPENSVERSKAFLSRLFTK